MSTTMTKQTTIINGSNNNTTPTPPHVVLVPLMAQGHTIPMLDMARLLAERGVHVTFITTPVNASRIKPIIARSHESNLPINFIELPFPCTEAGLPLGCENADLVPAIDLFLNFFNAIRLFALPLEQSLKNLVPRPTCMINDMSNPWAANIARSLNIRPLVFHGPSCIFIYCCYVFKLHNSFETVSDEFEEITVPGLTNSSDDVISRSFKVCKMHARGWLNAPGFEKLRDELLHAEEAADGVVINTFDDAEPLFVEAYKKVVGKDVWTVGPLCLCDHKDDLSSRIVRGNKAAVDQEKLFGWLDSMEERSVLYVSFGSLTRMNVGQILEIGSGLEASGVSFLWVIKDVEKCRPKVEEWLEGFEQRMSLRSFVIKGWAPQAAILSHKSVGGFVSHCGWNSTLEAMSNGVPMITWPQFADQFLNEKLVVELWRVGIAIGVKNPAFYYSEDEIAVKKDDVERAVRSLMGDGEEAEERRIRAREISEKTIKAMEEGGSSYKNITRLVEYIKHGDVQGTEVC